MSDPTFVTRAEEDQAEAEAFATEVQRLMVDAMFAAKRMDAQAYRGDFTIPPGTDCAAFEARIKAITADIEGMLDGYAPGEKRA